MPCVLSDIVLGTFRPLSHLILTRGSDPRCPWADGETEDIREPLREPMVPLQTLDDFLAKEGKESMLQVNSPLSRGRAC